MISKFKLKHTRQFYVFVVLLLIVASCIFTLLNTHASRADVLDKLVVVLLAAAGAYIIALLILSSYWWLVCRKYESS